MPWIDRISVCIAAANANANSRQTSPGNESRSNASAEWSEVALFGRGDNERASRWLATCGLAQRENKKRAR